MVMWGSYAFTIASVISTVVGHFSFRDCAITGNQRKLRNSDVRRGNGNKLQCTATQTDRPQFPSLPARRITLPYPLYNPEVGQRRGCWKPYPVSDGPRLDIGLGSGTLNTRPSPLVIKLFF